MTRRRAYPSDIGDEEWELIRQSLELLPPSSCQRRHEVREVLNALRYLVRSGGQRHMLPHDFPSWAVVYQQTRRWLDAGVFESLRNDLRALLRQAQGKKADPTACIVDRRTFQWTPETGARTGYHSGKRRKGSKVHPAVDTLGYPLAVHVSSANALHVAQLIETVQDVTGGNVAIAYADQGYSGEDPAKAANKGY